MVKFVTALAYHFCLTLPATFTQPGDHLTAEPCIFCLEIKRRRYLGVQRPSTSELARVLCSEALLEERFRSSWRLESKWGHVLRSSLSVWASVNVSPILVLGRPRLRPSFSLPSPNLEHFHTYVVVCWIKEHQTIKYVPD